VIGFEHGKIFLSKMRIMPMAGMERKKKRIVRVVRIEDQHAAKVEGVVTGNGREIGVKEVVFLLVKLRIVNRKAL